MSNTSQRGWTSEEASTDKSWTQLLSADEVGGFDAALAHAKGTGKSWLAMTAEDFPLQQAVNQLRGLPVLASKTAAGEQRAEAPSPTTK